MKKFFTLLSFLMLGTMLYAQSEYVFTDKDGNTIDEGTTIVRTEVEDDGFSQILKSGLFVKNVSAADGYQVAVAAEITRIDNGAVQLCFPVNCFSYSSVGTYGGKDKTSLPQGSLKDIQSEWIPTAYGECIVKYTAKSFQGVFPKTAYTVTVHYLYADPSGVEAVNDSQRAVVRECFDLQGRQTTARHHGLNIVRMSDGTVRKVFK